MAKVTYLTAYNKKLYEATGKNLAKSWLQYQMQPNIELIPFSEDINAVNPISPDYLDWYFQTFNHLIPSNLGGTAKPCKCPDMGLKGKTLHIPGCHWTLWNRNAYRWFHKVAAIKTWLDDHYKPENCDYMVWLDCDCYFKQHLPNSVINDLAFDSDLCYLQGKKREAIESGILIFNMLLDGKEVIEEWMRVYESKEFLNDNRWDDGFQLTIVKNRGFTGCDLVAGKTISRPADDCPLTPYIGHNKGTHVRDHKLF